MIKQHAKTLKVTIPRSTVEILSSSSHKNKKPMTEETSSGETSPTFDESKVVYLDDIEEVRSSPQPNIDSQDKRLFKFKASPAKGVNLSCKKEFRFEREGFLENKKAVSAAPCKDGNLSFKKECSLEGESFLENKKPVPVTYPDSRPSKTNIEEFISCDSDCSSNDGNDLPLPPYNRALTMPSGWLRRTEIKTRRSNSCPCQYPNHVHPKLPDCEEIAAKFLALKKEYIQTSHSVPRKTTKIVESVT